MEKRFSAVPVVDDERGLIGIVSEGDLVRHMATGKKAKNLRSWWLGLLSDPASQAQQYVKQHGRFAHEVMTREVTTVTEEATLPEIATLLEQRGIKRVPVMRDKQVVGIVSRANLLQGMATSEISTSDLQDDRVLKTAIDDAIKASGIRQFYFNVVVSDGVAHLWGAIESKEEHDALTVILENVEGLRGVESHLRIYPTEFLS
jgi:CBS-domain-containing membrane protein